MAAMLGIFGRLGRARDLRHLDDELRSAGLHPALTADAVKMTVIRLLKGAYGDAAPHMAEAAALVAYCTLGPDAYAETNGPDRTRAVESRVQAAVAEERGLDAELVLLTLHADVIHPDVVEAFGLDVDG
ncbi:MAG: hypothetical protein RIB45_06785 [Marivibrio sp.]|uniref:hypothetical protein n=1 Tax=Marivibrio sp. TaxID=2039719 RepID=UPI0032EAD357